MGEFHLLSPAPGGIPVRGSFIIRAGPWRKKRKIPRCSGRLWRSSQYRSISGTPTVASERTEKSPLRANLDRAVLHVWLSSHFHPVNPWYSWEFRAVPWRASDLNFYNSRWRSTSFQLNYLWFEASSYQGKQGQAKELKEWLKKEKENKKEPKQVFVRSWKKDSRKIEFQESLWSKSLNL